MNDEQKNDLVTTRTMEIASVAADTPVSVLPVVTDTDAAPVDTLECAEEEKSRRAWLNFASQDALRRLWDTPEEDEAWRDLLKEI